MSLQKTLAWTAGQQATVATKWTLLSFRLVQGEIDTSGDDVEGVVAIGDPSHALYHHQAKTRQARKKRVER